MAGDETFDNTSFDLTRRKKKKINRENPIDVVARDQPSTGAITVQDDERTYEDLLARVFNVIREKNPSVLISIQHKFTLKPPQLARSGTKQTLFLNFAEICTSLKRQEEHFQQYLLAELGSKGSIDKNHALTIQGRFQQNHIETILRAYIKEYVICKNCHLTNTVLQKEERLPVLQCNHCHSCYSVARVERGFQAQVGKRAATRA